MEKTVSVEQLRVGMYLSQPVYTHYKEKTPVLLLDENIIITSQRQLDTLRESHVSQVVIDSDKGADVSFGVRWKEPDPQIPAEKITQFQNLQATMGDSLKVQRQAIRQTQKLFEDTRSGRSLDTKSTRDLVGGMVKQFLSNSEAMAVSALLVDHDEYTFRHSVSVAVFVLTIAREQWPDLEPKTLEFIGLGGLLHDIGKMWVDAHIINKPGILSPDEMNEMRRHPQYSEQILKQYAEIPDEVLQMALSHHEKMDGSGYPHHLHDKEVSPYAMLTAISDIYDALTTRRSYKPPMLPDQAMKLIYLLKDKEFPGSLVDVFTRAVGIYPISSFVELSDGHCGVVISTNKEHPYSPLVGIVLDEHKALLEHVELVDLETHNRQHPGKKLTIIRTRDPIRYGINAVDYLQSSLN